MAKPAASKTTAAALRPDGTEATPSATGPAAEPYLSKAEVARRGLRGQVRVNAAGCLDACADGPTIVVYPEGVWYARVRLEDVPELVESHLVNGVPVERLRSPRFR